MEDPYVRFRLQRGAGAPVQRSSTTCGSASLTVARMLADPDFAGWVTADTDPAGSAGGPDRFAECEQRVLREANRLRVRGGSLALPWPRALGTSPLGARRELEAIAAASSAGAGGGRATTTHSAEAVGGSRSGYAVDVVRWLSPRRLREAHQRLGAAARAGAPVLLYVGSALLPRHVVLVLPDGAVDAGSPATASTAPDVYDPATGVVSVLDADAFAGRRLALAGWDVPWLVLRPRS